VALVTGPGDVGIGRVDLGRAVAPEGEAHPVAARWRARPPRVEGPDGVLGVEREPQAAFQLHVHVRLLAGVRRDAQADAPVEGQGRGHVGDDELDEGQLKVHAMDASRDRAGRLEGSGHGREYPVSSMRDS